VPNRHTAEDLAKRLVQQKLAACVNIIPGVTSIYEWQDTLHSDEEWLLLIKTLKSAYLTVESHLRSWHPYELPEIIMVPIDAGSPAYLDWVAKKVLI